MEFQYRLKSQFVRAGMNGDWLPITEQKIQAVKKMRPNMFEFAEIKPPTPTKSMEVAEISTKKKQPKTVKKKENNK